MAGWTLLKLQTCALKDTVKRMIKQNTDFEKTPTKHISDKGLMSKIYKELLKLNNRKSINPIKNRRRRCLSHQRHIHIAKKHRKGCLT